MRVVQLAIKNFRGIKSAKLNFDGHTLLVGANNVGKSNVCEALELALGVDRLKRFPPVEEFDFHNARYLDKSTNPPTPIPIEIEVVLTHLSEELSLRCADKTEHWHTTERRLLGEGEVDLVDHPAVEECLRIQTIARYNAEEDEFEAKSVFCGGAPKPDGQPVEVSRSIRQLFGFSYLRALRTGSRALSLERGTLLDLILRRRNIRTGIWENAIEQLRGLDPPIDEGAADLVPVLENIEKRLAQYIPLNAEGRATQLYVSQLSREHLRRTISFFLRTEAGQEAVPFQNVGAGTLNTLVLALLSFIAETKKDSVVFAMEEPEIAVPPHTQRRIANYLLGSSDQCFVTSHSPYVIERFEPEQIRILRKENDATLVAKELRVGEALKAKTYRRHSRRWFAEAMLGRGVIVGEGITERDIVLAAAEKLEANDPDACYPLDLSGVSVMSVDGEGALAGFGEFFADLGIKAYALFDAKPMKPEVKDRIEKAYAYPCQTKYRGAEKLLIEECPVNRLWQLLEEIRDSSEKPGLVPIGAMPTAEETKKIAGSLLQNDKGSGYAGRLIELCEVAELPPTIVDFMRRVYEEFKKPEPVPPLEDLGTPATATAEGVGAAEKVAPMVASDAAAIPAGGATPAEAAEAGNAAPEVDKGALG
jgi:putative ATP-dependent endonuclease of OLD family